MTLGHSPEISAGPAVCSAWGPVFTLETAFHCPQMPPKCHAPSCCEHEDLNTHASPNDEVTPETQRALQSSARSLQGERKKPCTVVVTKAISKHNGRTLDLEKAELGKATGRESCTWICSAGREAGPCAMAMESLC